MLNKRRYSIKIDRDHVLLFGNSLIGRLSSIFLCLQTNYSAQIKPNKTIKTIKTENITQTQYDVIVSSQGIAVNK